jgi:hypothetical protein
MSWRAGWLPNQPLQNRSRMKYFLRRGVVVAAVILPVSVISWCVRPLLGVAFFITATSALAINGFRAALGAVPMHPADADDPMSPPAIARVLHSQIRGHTIFLGAMSVVYAIAAVRTAELTVRIFATSFALAAFAAGPGTLLRRRLGLWAAGISVVAGLILWWLQRGRV